MIERIYFVVNILFCIIVNTLSGWDESNREKSKSQGEGLVFLLVKIFFFFFKKEGNGRTVYI